MQEVGAKPVPKPVQIEEEKKRVNETEKVTPVAIGEIKFVEFNQKAEPPNIQKEQNIIVKNDLRPQIDEERKDAIGAKQI